MGKLITLGYLGSYPSYPVSTKKPDLSAIRRANRRAQDWNALSNSTTAFLTLLQSNHDLRPEVDVAQARGRER
jgi:hypothetical protein